MPRTPPTPAEVVAHAMDGLSRLVRNLLVDNPNLRPGPDGVSHHGRETPRTDAFAARQLKSYAEAILDRVGQVREVALVQAADPEVPGLARSYDGLLHGCRVRMRGNPDGTWVVSIGPDGAFHGGDDVEATLPDETAAIEAARAFARTGEIPDALRDGTAGPAP